MYLFVETCCKLNFFFRKVDSKILTILRQRRQQCEAYEGPDAPKKCQKFVKDLADAEENWFIKCKWMITLTCYQFYCLCLI